MATASCECFSYQLPPAARNMVLASLILLIMSSCSAQPVTEAVAGLVAAQPAVVVEPMGVGLPVSASTARVEASPTTTAVLKRHSRLQALSALQRAKPWRPATAQAPQPAAGGVAEPAAICGSSSLVADNQLSNCRIVTTYSSGVATSCSASKIGTRTLATAGHCIYSKPHGGWAQSIDVYCTGSRTCSVQRSSYGTHITTTPSWMASSTDIPTAFDGAVIKTGTDLPGRILQLGQISNAGSYRVTLTGYPAQSADPGGCSSSSYAGACYQYSSTDTIGVTSSGMYSSSNLDLCSGHSGSGVMTADANRYIVAVVSGASFQPCANYFVPQINSNFVNTHCEKTSGGVSFACLAAKLPA